MQCPDPLLEHPVLVLELASADAAQPRLARRSAFPGVKRLVWNRYRCTVTGTGVLLLPTSTRRRSALRYSDSSSRHAPAARGSQYRKNSHSSRGSERSLAPLFAPPAAAKTGWLLATSRIRGSLTSWMLGQSCSLVMSNAVSHGRLAFGSGCCSQSLPAPAGPLHVVRRLSCPPRFAGSCAPQEDADIRVGWCWP